MLYSCFLLRPALLINARSIVIVFLFVIVVLFVLFFVRVGVVRSVYAKGIRIEDSRKDISVDVL
jgi:hypothetical protein